MQCVKHELICLLEEMIAPSASTRCPLPVNSADESVSVEGHYLAYQSAKASNTRRDGQRLVQSLRDRSLETSS